MDQVTFVRCERGFLFRESHGRDDHGFHKVFAFDNVEEAAAWLVERFTPAVAACTCTPTK